MGTIYMVERADGHFAQTGALKARLTMGEALVAGDARIARFRAALVRVATAAGSE